MSEFDHLFVLLFAVVYPLYGFWSYRKNLPQILKGEIKLDCEYFFTSGLHWVLAICGIVLWWSLDRKWSDLGFSLTLEPGLLLALVLVLLGIVYLVMQLKYLRQGDEKFIEQLGAEFESVIAMLPKTKKELNAFYALSVTAGVVEELLFRGYLIWYLNQYMSLWLAVIISSVLFGLGHAYQGVKNIGTISVVGLLFAVLYLLSGSLWLPIIAHAIMDILQGRIAYEYVHRNKSKQVEPQ